MGNLPATNVLLTFYSSLNAGKKGLLNLFCSIKQVFIPYYMEVYGHDKFFFAVFVYTPTMSREELVKATHFSLDSYI